MAQIFGLSFGTLDKALLWFSRCAEKQHPKLGQLEMGQVGLGPRSKMIQLCLWSQNNSVCSLLEGFGALWIGIRIQPIYRQVPGVGAIALKMVAKPHRKIVMDLFICILYFVCMFGFPRAMLIL